MSKNDTVIIRRMCIKLRYKVGKMHKKCIKIVYESLAGLKRYRKSPGKYKILSYFYGFTEIVCINMQKDEVLLHKRLFLWGVYVIYMPYSSI